MTPEIGVSTAALYPTHLTKEALTRIAALGFQTYANYFDLWSSFHGCEQRPRAVFDGCWKLPLTSMPRR